MIIHNKFLPKYYLKELQDYFLSDCCEWYYQEKISGVESNSNLGSFGFSSNLFSDGAYVPNFPGTLCRSLVAHVQEAVESFNESYQSVIRARADMTLYNPDNISTSTTQTLTSLILLLSFMLIPVMETLC